MAQVKDAYEIVAIKYPTPARHTQLPSSLTRAAALKNLTEHTRLAKNILVKDGDWTPLGLAGLSQWSVYQ